MEILGNFVKLLIFLRNLGEISTFFGISKGKSELFG